MARCERCGICTQHLEDYEAGDDLTVLDFMRRDPDVSGSTPARERGEEVAKQTTWTDAEDAVLREEWAKGYGAAGRAEKRLDGRDAGAIRNRARRLGIRQGRDGEATSAGQDRKTGSRKATATPGRKPKAAPAAGRAAVTADMVREAAKRLVPDAVEVPWGEGVVLLNPATASGLCFEPGGVVKAARLVLEDLADPLTP